MTVSLQTHSSAGGYVCPTDKGGIGIRDLDTTNEVVHLIHNLEHH